MKRKWLPVSVFILGVVMVAHAGCGGSSTPNFRPTTIPVTPTPQSASTTVPLSANTALSMPTLAGVVGTFKESAPLAQGATVALTSYAGAPSGAPLPLSSRRKSLSGSTTPSVGNAVFLVSQVYSAPMNFASFPATTWQLPPALGQGPFELETIDGTTDRLLDTEYQASFSNSTVSFSGTSAPFVTTLGHTYWWELVTGFASPPPSGCGSNNVTVALTSAALTVPQPVACNFTGSLQISSNNAPSGTSLLVSSLVPAQPAVQEPPPPSSTSTGIVSVSLEVDQSTTFNPGLLQFTMRFPSNAPIGTKQVYLSACTMKAQSFDSNPLTYDGCIDTPVTAGPLAVIGQTVSFEGLTASLTLPASFALQTQAKNSASDPSICFKHCTPPPTHYYYLYTVALWE